MWDLLKRQSPSPTVEQIFELANYSLQQIGDWIGLSKKRLSQLKYNSTVVVNRTEVALRNAYEAAAQQRFPIATTALSQIINEEEDPRTKGYLLQIVHNMLTSTTKYGHNEFWHLLVLSITAHYSQSKVFSIIKLPSPHTK